MDYYRASKDKMVEDWRFDSGSEQGTQSFEENWKHLIRRSWGVPWIGLERVSDILIYKFINDLSNAEIAEVLGQSEEVLEFFNSVR